MFTDVEEMMNPNPKPSMADCNTNRGKRKINGEGQVTEPKFDERYIQIASKSTMS